MFFAFFRRDFLLSLIMYVLVCWFAWVYKWAMDSEEDKGRYRLAL